MPVLCFSSVEAYRATLASGAVPAGVARRATAGAVDAAGRVWVTGSAEASPPAPDPPVPLRPLVGWAELVPLQRSDSHPPGGPLLVAGPATCLASACTHASHLWLPGATESPILECRIRPLVVSDHVTVFWPQAPRVWVPVGWRHPLPELLAAPAGCRVVVRPQGPWLVMPDRSGYASQDGFRLAGRRTVAEKATQPERITLRLSTRSRPQADDPDCFWILPDDPWEYLRALANELPEPSLRRLSLASVADESGSHRVLLRAGGKRGKAADVLPAGRGFVRHPAVAGVHLPAGRGLRPELRRAILAELTAASADRVVWLDTADDGRVRCDTAPVGAFHPLPDHIEYVAPVGRRLSPHGIDDPFRMPTIAATDDQRSSTGDIVLPVPPQPAPPAAGLPSPSGRFGWMSRLAARIRGNPAIDPPSPPDADPGDPAVVPPETDRHNLSARQTTLEQRALALGSQALPLGRAKVWAELAAVYDAVGDPADAAVCWLNAVWDHPAPPSGWVARWLQAEERKGGGRSRGRTTAVRLVQECAGAVIPNEVAGLVKQLDAHEADVPIRAVWLARTAVARAVGDDPLGLARCRDRLFRRMAAAGPKLDVDTPRFLRFHDRGGERAAAVRDWLAGVREPVHKWLGKLGTVGRLQWAGIDPEVTATTAYADLMLAWGLAKAADRDAARGLADEATAVLNRGDDEVRQRLLTAFRRRIDAALDGTADRLPPTPTAEPDELARYSVDALRSHSRILEPVDRVDRFAGRDVVGFLGTDDLGIRLRSLFSDPGRITSDSWGELRDAITADPTATTLPRVVFTALELAPHAGSGVAADILPHVVQAIDLLSEWARLNRADDDPAASARRFGRRMLSAAIDAARLFHLPDGCRQLIDGLIAAGPTAPSAAAATRTAASLFRACRRLGVVDEAARLVAVLSAGSRGGERDLGVAVGRFVVGDTDGALRTLDAARARLFAPDRLDPRRRTALALAYADALGHAPVRVALGRLAELFTRLGPIAVHGATNRYFTLKPLALIDTVVRAVVGDEFELGPAVRNWLDDDEYLIRRRITRDLDRALVGSGPVPATPARR